MSNSSHQLKKLRKYFDYTQSEFADIAKTKRNSISMIESERNKPTFELIEELCGAFNITADYFLTNDNPDIYDNQMQFSIHYKKDTKNITKINTKNVQVKTPRSVQVKSKNTSESKDLSNFTEGYDEFSTRKNEAFNIAKEWLKDTIPVKPHFYFKIHEILRREDSKLYDIKNNIDILNTFKDALTQLDEVFLSEVVKYFFRFEGEQFDIKQYKNAVKTALNDIIIYEQPLGKLSKAIYEFYNEMNSIGIDGINFDDYKLKNDKI